MNTNITTTESNLDSAELDALLTDLYNAFDPNKAAPEDYYVDLSGARGSKALAEVVIKRLRRILPGTYQRCLFSGHIGGGKSSELLHLADLLKDTTADAMQQVGGRRFFPVYLNTDEYLNNEDAGLPDLLLAIAAEIGVALKESSLKIELADNYFIDLLRRTRETLFAELGVEKVEAGVSIPNALSSLKAVISPLRRDESARSAIRHALTTQVESLRSAVNLVLDKARLRMKEFHYPSDEPPYDDIVLIIDNLDKVRRFAGEANAEQAAFELFIRNAPTLTALNAHITYTLPLRALYAFPGDLQSAYGAAPFTMPMVAVEQRDNIGVPYEKGYSYLKKMLGQRLEGHSVDQIFTEDALRWLIQMSGGHVRSLMIFVQSAIAETDTLPIEIGAARRATAPTLQMYSRSVKESYFPIMAALNRSERRTIDTSEIAERAMLEQLMVLEYNNGTNKPDGPPEPWYAVNPIVRQLSGFKAALDAYDLVHAENSTGKQVADADSA